jgi:hypothetical protein
MPVREDVEREGREEEVEREGREEREGGRAQGWPNTWFGS